MVRMLANYGGATYPPLWGYSDLFQSDSGACSQSLKRDQGLCETEKESAPFESQNLCWLGVSPFLSQRVRVTT